MSALIRRTATTSIELRRELGVSAVLNLQTDEDLERLECNWPQLRAHYRRSKMVVRRVPVRDYDSDDLRKHLPECVQTLHELIRDDHIVYVHCTAGLGCSPSVVVTYLNWVQQCDLDKAVHHVVACRPCSPNVDAIQQASEDLLAE